MAPYSRSFSRVPVRAILEAEGEGASLAGRSVAVGGWVKTGREAGAGAFAFLELNDGSCFANLQVMVDKDVAAGVGGLGALTPTSTCVLVEGVLAETPPGTKQKVCALRGSVAMARQLGRPASSHVLVCLLSCLLGGEERGHRGPAWAAAAGTWGRRGLAHARHPRGDREWRPSIMLPSPGPGQGLPAMMDSSS